MDPGIGKASQEEINFVLFYFAAPAFISSMKTAAIILFATVIILLSIAITFSVTLGNVYRKIINLFSNKNRKK